MPAEQTTGRRSRLLPIVAGVVALVLLAVVILHLPPVRRAVLSAGITFAERSAGVRIQADRLDYNLLTLRVSASGVAVAAEHSPELPFFEADRVAVVLPYSVLGGLFALEEITIEGGRVRIVGDTGDLNLPRGTSTGSAEPSPLDLGRVRISGLAVEIRDGAAGYQFDLPGVALDMSADAGSFSAEGGRFTYDGRALALTRLAGGLAFDGRQFVLREMDLVSDAASIRVDGTMTVLAQAPSLDLRLSGEADLIAVTTLAGSAPIFDGTVTVEGGVAGPLASPLATLRVRSGQLVRDGLTLSDIDLATRVSVAGADIDEASISVAGGRVEGTARVAFDGGESRVAGDWSNIDLADLLTAVLDPQPMLPTGRTSGTVSSRGAGFDLGQWATDLDARVAASPNSPGRVAVPGALRLQARDGRWRVDGQHLAGGVAPLSFALAGSIEADGRLPVAGSVDLASTEVAELGRLGTQIGVADVPESLVTGGTLSAALEVSGDLTSPAITGTARVDEVLGEGFRLVEGDISLDGRPLEGDVRASVRGGPLRVAGQEVEAFAAEGGISDGVVDVASLTATQAVSMGSLRGSGTYTLETGTYRGLAELADWVVDAPQGVPVRGIVSGRYEGTGSLAQPGGELRASMAETVYDQVPLGTVSVGVIFEGQQARFDLGIPRLGLSGRGQSGIAAPYQAVVDVDATALDLATLEALLPAMPVPLRGTLTATLHAEGPLAQWRDLDATLVLTGAEAMLGELAVALDGPAQVTYGMGALGTTRLIVRAGGIRADVAGSLAVERPDGLGREASITVTGDIADAVEVARLAGVTGVPDVIAAGPFALMGLIGGALAAPEVEADLDIGPASVVLSGSPPLERLRVLARLARGRVELQELFAAVEDTEVRATGSAPLTWVSPTPLSANVDASMATLRAQLTNVTAGLLSRLATGAAAPDVAGSLDATIELSSASPQLADLTGEARIDRLSMTAAGISLTQRVPTRVVAADGFARIAGWDWTGEGTSLTVSGQVRLSNLQTGILADGDIDLRLLSPFLRSAGIGTAGRLTPRLSVTGALTSPRIDGDITLVDGDLRLASPRVFVSDLGGRAIFSRDTLRIATMDGSINGGNLTIGGSVSFAPGTPLSAVLTAEVTGMALDYPEGLRTELDGSLRLGVGDERGGQGDIPLLSGALRVRNGSYRQPITVVGGLLAALQSGASGGPPVAAAGAWPLELDVTLTTDEDIIVDNNAATLALDADVRVIGTLARPALSGRAEVREGGQVLLGRNSYQVVAGTLDFANPTRIDPELNVQLTTRAGGVPIEVTVTGSAAEPMVELSSEDAELGQSDLTSLLLTGRPLDQLGSADAALVSSVLVGNLSGEVGQVLGLAGRVVGLDTIRLGGVDETLLQSDPSAIATATDPTSRLTFGKSIGSNVDVTFSQSLRDGQAQTWIVDYLPSRRLLARLVSNDANLRSYEFRHDVQFGANVRAREREAAVRREVPLLDVVNVEGALVEEDVRRLLQVRAGRAFDFQAMQADRERIERYYRESGYLTARVGARQRTADGLVEVTFTVQPGLPTRLEVTGEPLTAGLRRQVEDVWADSIAGPLLVDEVQTLVRDDLARDGYLRATVEAALAEIDGTQVLTVAAQRGPRTTDIVVAIEGVSPELTGQLNRYLNAADLVRVAPRDPQAVARGLQQALAARGYEEARVLVGAPMFDGEVATVTVQVQADAPAVVGTITVRGSSLEAEPIRRVMGLEEGTPFVQVVVDSLAPQLETYYRQEGYPEAMVAVTTSPGAVPGVTDILVSVTEGPRQVVSSVSVQGLRGIAGDVAIRAMNLPPGSVARSEALLRARTGLLGTGLFRRVDVTASPDTDAPTSENEQPMQVVATVEEWPTARFRYGLLVAEERPDEESRRRELVPGLSADVTRRTLFGRAISVGGATVLQQRNRLGRMFVSAPTFLSLPLRTSIVVQKRRQEFGGGDNVSDTTGISLEQRTTVFGRLVLTYAYRFERVHSFVTGPSDPNFPVFDISLNVARFTASGAWDSRDDPTEPTRGSLFTSSIEDAPDLLGSQIRFVRYFGQARHFQAWRGVVFASAFQYGHVTPLGGQEVIPSERFYTGGATSIRGLPENGAGDTDFFGPVGGRVLMLLNQEARVPVYRWLQGVAFVDAGNVFGTSQDRSFRNLVTSAGAGVRVVTPFALLRIDYGRVIRGGTADGAQSRWSVGIGHVF